MKLETLIIRYETMGYVPCGGSKFKEINSICEWLYEKYKIYVGEHYCDLNFKGSHEIHWFI